MGISTKITPTTSVGGGSFIQKSLQPGVAKCVLHSIKLEKLAYIKERDEYSLILSLEGEPLGDSFVGFPKVFGDNAGQKFVGQQAFVKSSNWGYYDGKTGNGYDCSVQDSVLGFLQELCTELGILSWFHSIDGKYNTLQEIVQAMNEAKPFEGIWINYLLASRVYQNKAGYDAHDLHLVRSTKEGKAFSGDLAQIMKFDPTKHIYRPKAKDAVAKTNTSETAALEADHKAQQAKLDVDAKPAGLKLTAEESGDFLQEIENAGTKAESGSDIVTDDDSDLPFDLK